MKATSTILLLALLDVATFNCGGGGHRPHHYPEDTNVVEFYQDTPKTLEVNGVEFTMMPVEGGTFTMDVPNTEANADKSTQREVTVSNFMLSEMEVTHELWVAVTNTYLPNYSEEYLQRSVDNLTPEDYQFFLKRLNRLTGCAFRLPTEEEWKYAMGHCDRLNGTNDCYTSNGNIVESEDGKNNLRLRLAM